MRDLHPKARPFSKSRIFSKSWRIRLTVLTKGIATVANGAYNLPNPTALDDFLFFVSKPMEEWFPGDPMKRWLDKPEGHGHGWETFYYSALPAARMKALTAAKKQGMDGEEAKQYILVGEAK